MKNLFKKLIQKIFEIRCCGKAMSEYSHPVSGYLFCTKCGKKISTE